MRLGRPHQLPAGCFVGQTRASPLQVLRLGSFDVACHVGKQALWDGFSFVFLLSQPSWPISCCVHKNHAISPRLSAAREELP